VLPTVGGQTALNLAIELSDGGVLEKYNVHLIGAQISAIKKAEDRLSSKTRCSALAWTYRNPRSSNNLKDGLEFAARSAFR